MDVQSLVWKLLETDNSHDARSLLERAGYWDDPSAWRPYGGTDSNLGIISSQQADPVAAIVEKIVNSIDAVLMLHCQLKNVDPESFQAADSMQQAVREYLGWEVPTWVVESSAELAKRANHIHLVFSGKSTNPTIDIVDNGEGQRPSNFERTFVSLNQIRKSKVSFVQGKYNMGSTGVLNFLGGQRLQMIISRRNSGLDQNSLEKTTFKNENSWGVTIVRSHYYEELNQSLWEFLAPNGRILSWEHTSMRLVPERSPYSSENEEIITRFSEELDSGTTIRLWDYDYSLSNIVLHRVNWRRKLEALLPRISIPISIWDCRRDVKSGKTISSGQIVGTNNRTYTMRDLRAADGGDYWEAFRTSFEIEIDNYKLSIETHYPVRRNEEGNIIEVRVFHDSDRIVYQAGYGPIFYIVNGQTHSFETALFFNQKAVSKLRDLQYGLMVYVDLTEMIEKGMNVKEVEDLFMASRDRFRESELAKEIKSAVADALGKSEELQKLAQMARAQKHRASTAQSEEDKKEWSELYNRIGSGSAGIYEPEEPIDTTLLQPKKFPDKWRLVKPRVTALIDEPEHGFEVETAPRVEFASDAEAEYFTRTDEPGTITVFSIDSDTGEASQIQHRINKSNGRFVLTLPGLSTLQIGERVKCRSSVTDPQRERIGDLPWVNKWVLYPKPPGLPPDPPDSPKPEPVKPSVRLQPPEIRYVEKKDWEEHHFDQYDGLEIGADEDVLTTIYINADNKFLLETVDSVQNDDTRDQIRQYYYRSLAADAVGIWNFFTKPDTDETNITNRDSLAEARLFSRVIAQSRAEFALQMAKKL